MLTPRLALLGPVIVQLDIRGHRADCEGLSRLTDSFENSTRGNGSRWINYTSTDHLDLFAVNCVCVICQIWTGGAFLVCSSICSSHALPFARILLARVTDRYGNTVQAQAGKKMAIVMFPVSDSSFHVFDYLSFLYVWSLTDDGEAVRARSSVPDVSAGNLGRVDYISEFEFDLFIRPDTCNPRFRVWFNFTVENVRETQVSTSLVFVCSTKLVNVSAGPGFPE